jgi:uncharacterized protein Yka (UPF0111/DUF47 family)
MAIKLFGRTRRLIGDIDDFLTLLAECTMTFGEAMRSVQRDMYAETLMPDARGDILSLLESLDEIINKLEETLWYFSSEQPQIPEDLREEYDNLVAPTTECVDQA